MNDRQRQQALDDLARRTDQRLWSHMAASCQVALGMRLWPGMQVSDGAVLPVEQAQPAPQASEPTPAQLRRAGLQLLRAWKVAARAQLALRLKKRLPAALAMWLARRVPAWVLERMDER